VADLLVIERLRVAYGDYLAVKDVSISIAPATTFALLGANGAGKSSTLKAIAGLVRKRAGRVLFEGTDVTGADAAQLVRRGISYVPEGREIVGTLTVDENLTLGGYHVPRAQFRSRRNQVLDLFPELAEKLQQGAWGLSGGQQQMLAIGRALMSGPRVLLLDEPSLGLAPVLVQRVFARLSKLRQDTGLTIVLVEQDVPLAARLADQAGVLRNGEIVVLADSAQLKDPEGRARLIGSYLGGGSATAAPVTAQ
jgi:branched-chain amino acid transport system ATP-binding protein